ncbi:hypothetical protein HGQ17_06710 [Nesterenkonia sp. MY13]|uniref:Type I restriction modification DNA specificity domain-containing protein n=1 Tax=Nesterenkonia sedimenti TaxID=1463632 RepID=A0A7X8YDQ2_9MICC|nr:restriction endonuclease subunit S [Nesterenkonia sedimenti]NLS09700.1 hypothetical protein [Nesterenkonia sedimenti]
MTKYELRSGDVVIAMDRPWISAGLKYAVVREADLPAMLVQRVARLRARDHLDQRYLGYIIGSRDFTNYIRGTETGSAVPHISGTQIMEFPLPPLPPLEEQRGIAATLGALDDKIDSNCRAIDSAEDLGEALFRKAADKVQTLTDIAEVTMGSSPPGDTYNEEGEGVPFYQGVKDFGVRHPSYRVWTTGPVRTAHANATLISVRAPVGRLNRAKEYCCIGRGLAAVTSSFPSTCYYSLQAADAVWAPFEQEGTVFGSMNKKSLTSAQVPWPSESGVRELEAQLSSLDTRITSLTDENRKLSGLRDALLPELLSGRVRVPEAAEAVGEGLGV